VIFFVRHGETALNRDGRLQGRIDLELSERGGEQAARVAQRFAPESVTRVYTSPLRRAQQTAAAISAASGAAVEIDDRLLELDYGEWDGKPLAEMRTPRGELWFADPTFAPPGGESLVAVTARVEAFCRDRLRPDGDDRIVAVSHVSPIKAAVIWALGVDEHATLRMQLGLASITTIGARTNGSSYLVGFNDCAHLDRAR
jgi:broad specificity phosphatase PhoE